ncbi:hypothetical protein HanRHA438_Chr09g0430111 [Helianthus annuus]|nr:hypothetical protein HanIR_Chr09g0450461 [Helianthus annuus]KAJ0891013.1 hypothetical protein HanRHA438_Chr09g0430111 [Helianthus annuus]
MENSSDQSVKTDGFEFESFDSRTRSSRLVMVVAADRGWRVSEVVAGSLFVCERDDKRFFIFTSVQNSP